MSTSRWRMAFAIVVVTGVALRLAAARGDLWLDEIWSLMIALDVASPAGVFTQVHHDNNHHLNTLYLHLVGDGRAPLLYRLLAVGSGGAMLALAAARAPRDGRLQAFTTTTLLSACFFVVQYTSEARGYGPAMLCALAAFTALDLYLTTRALRWAAVCAVAASVGILSHLTFVFVLAGLLACAGADALRTRRPDWRAAALLLAPLGVLAALWALDLRHLVAGGGPEYRLAEVVRELARATFGLPRGPLELLAVAIAGAAAFELVLMARAREPRAAFFVATAAAPAILLALFRPVHVAPRFFAVCVPFALVLASRSLTRVARRGAAGRVGYAVLLAGFVVANVVAGAGLLRDGRGGYRAAIEFMQARSPEDVVTVGSDHDFRNVMVLAYHSRELGRTKPIAYVPQAEWTPATRPPAWFLRHDSAERSPWARAGGHAYRLAAAFPHGGMSGWDWLVYRIVDGRRTP